MGDHQQRDPVFPNLFINQGQRAGGGLRVEVAGRLIGQDQARPMYERPRQCHTLLFAAGLLAAHFVGVDIVILAIGTGLAAFLGDHVGFIMGRNLGRPYLDARTGPRMKAIVSGVEQMYQRYGWWSVVVARFVPWARVFVPWVAGIGRMNYYRFLTANALGAMLWGIGLTFAGWGAYFIPGVKSAAYVIAGVVILMSVIAGFRTWRANRVEL
jgi:membrane-associated protein